MSWQQYRAHRAEHGPVIHFAARTDAAEAVHHGPALCRAGYAHRTEHEQYIAGDWAHVTCRNCSRIKHAVNNADDRIEAAMVTPPARLVHVVTWETCTGSLEGETNGIEGIYADETTARRARRAEMRNWLQQGYRVYSRKHADNWDIDVQLTTHEVL